MLLLFNEMYPIILGFRILRVHIPYSDGLAQQSTPKVYPGTMVKLPEKGARTLKKGVVFSVGVSHVCAAYGTTYEKTIPDVHHGLETATRRSPRCQY